MADCILPENPEPRFILTWLTESYSMDISALAWMFQTSADSIRSWMKGETVSHKNLMKLRKSYYFLNGTVDPHAGERRCMICDSWRPSSDFKNSLCSSCSKTGIIEK